MQRRIEETNRHRQTLHGFEEAHEILTLKRQELHNRLAAINFLLRDNHLTHRCDALRSEEHMLRAGKPDAFGAEGARLRGVLRAVGIGAYTQSAEFICPSHELRVILIGRKVRPYGRHLPLVDPAYRTVERNPVSVLYCPAADPHILRIRVDDEGGAAEDEAFAPSAGN